MKRCGGVLLLTAALLIAQLGIATHSLHLDSKQDQQKIELTCAFCIAGAHFGAAPTVATVHIDFLKHEVVEFGVVDVCDACILVTPRLTRGPPVSLT